MSEDIKHQNEDINASYDMLTDREHVLIRPTVYVGSVIPETYNDYVLDEETGKFKSDVGLFYSKGLITLFNELLNNSYDEYVRTYALTQARRLSKIDVTIDKSTGLFKITDNGGIPVQMHAKHKMMLPTMLFGHLRSGSNYGENRGKVSGTNGVGASLVNVFSSRFEVQTNDTKKTYHGVWNENMKSMSHDTARAEKKSKGFTTISAYVDFDKVCKGFTGYTDDLIQKIKNRCIELAVMGCDKNKPLEVTFTITDKNKKLESFSYKFNEFQQYVEMFDLDEEHFQGFGNEHMDFVVGCSSSDSTESVAILNSVRCDHGTHIDLLSDKIVIAIRDFLVKKHKFDLKPKQIKDRLRFISRWSIGEPSFDTQTKDRLTTIAKDFGFDIELPVKFVKWLEKSEIINRLVDFYNSKKNEDEASQLRKLQNKKIRPNNIEKLIDASSKNRNECEIFITEGDSAQNGVRTSRDAETQGAFCVGGKFINALDKKPTEIMKVKGKEDDSKAKNLMDALGISFTEGIKGLRWGKIYIMTDADYDGYGIASQLVLFLRKYWPELFNEGRVFRVQSPIMVARKGDDVKVYYSMPEYEKQKAWLDRNKYKTKHIKGLASLREEEYDDVINNPKLQQIVCDDNDMETLEAWFGKDSEIRKEYIKTDFVYN